MCSAASVDLSYSGVLHRDLSTGLEALLLNSYLHLVYLVTPYDMIDQCKPDWMIFFRQVSRVCLRAPPPPHVCHKPTVLLFLSSRCCRRPSRRWRPP